MLRECAIYMSRTVDVQLWTGALALLDPCSQLGEIYHFHTIPEKHSDMSVRRDLAVRNFLHCSVDRRIPRLSFLSAWHCWL